MNKAAIKNFAIWARNKLIADIEYKAGLMGISETGIKDALPQSTKDMELYDIGTKDPYVLSGKAIMQRKRLVELIRQKAKSSDQKLAYHNVVEEVAYTWFNRLIAIRFMEVNDYLPSHIRVLSSDSESKTEPDLVTTPFYSGLDFSQSEREEVLRFKQENRVDDLFRMVFIKQCNALNEILPHLFEKTEDYSELLLNFSATDQNGVVYHLVHDIAEDDFNVEKEGQIEIIGWLYQYYNTELKDETFSLLKKNVKIVKERIPSATQLFTPDWIVRYMVENSLGRYWVDHLKGNYEKFLDEGGIDESGEGVGDIVESFLHNWKYYVLDAEQTDEVETELRENRKEIAQIFPQDIKLIDPCMGSGHILVYAFDVFVQIYTSKGYSGKEAVKEIIENNLFGLEIDDRAYQLSYFALMMKGCQYDRRFLTRGFEPNLCSIQESNDFNKDYLDLFEREKETAEKIVDLFKDAKEYGSILNVDISIEELTALNVELQRIVNSEYDNIIDSIRQMGLMSAFTPLLNQAMIMAQKYEVVVTNPPYMGSSGMSLKLSDYVKNNYPDSKSDLFAVFIERCEQLTKTNCYTALITQHAWMFLSSFEKLRGRLLLHDTVNMAHLGPRAFDEIGGEVVQTTAFVRRKNYVEHYKGTYYRLIDPTTQQGKEDMFLRGENRFVFDHENFSKIPGSPFAYWVSEHFTKHFNKNQFTDLANAKSGLSTTDNDRFLRLWFEITYNKISFVYTSLEDSTDCEYIFVPQPKGGAFRKWYGNIEYVVDWYNNGTRIRKAAVGASGGRIVGSEYYFKKGLTWSDITSSGNLSVRYMPKGMIFNSSAPSCFAHDDINILYIAGFMNTIIAKSFLLFLAPTFHFNPGPVEKLPVIVSQQYFDSIYILVENNIKISKFDWDSFETSWDFKRHPLVANCVKVGWGDDGPISGWISQSYNIWKDIVEHNFLQLKANEEELNRIFIDIYGLNDELTPDVLDKDVTVARIYDSKNDIPESMKGNGYVLTKADVVKSLISYAVGCMFGRYSLDEEGLAYAGGEFSDQWTVMGGQYYRNEVIKKYGCQNISRPYGLAKSNGFGDRSIQIGEVASQ